MNVLVGGGFGGLPATRLLARKPVDVTLIDRRNHHLFQPSLYQVATGMLSPGQIAPPIRHAVRRYQNVRVELAEVTGFDLERRIVRGSTPVQLRAVELPYDSLIVAAGATQSYFGHDDFARFAPGMKTIEDASPRRRRGSSNELASSYEWVPVSSAWTPSGSTSPRRTAPGLGSRRARPSGRLGYRPRRWQPSWPKRAVPSSTAPAASRCCRISRCRGIPRCSPLETWRPPRRRHDLEPTQRRWPVAVQVPGLEQRGHDRTFRAVASVRTMRLSGFLGWMIWFFAHLAFLTVPDTVKAVVPPNPYPNAPTAVARAESSGGQVDG